MGCGFQWYRTYERGNLVEIRIPKKCSVCVFILQKFLRNPNLNEITREGTRLRITFALSVKKIFIS